MTPTRSFNPWATPRHHHNPGPDQPLTIRRTDTPTTITTRQAGHQDWDTICDHWQAITQLADNEPDPPNIASHIGPPRGGTTSTADQDAHRNQHLEHQAAIAWTRERDRLINDLTRLAQRAPIVNTPPAKPSKEQLPRCVKCGQDIDPQADDGKAHIVNTHPLHANTCYHQIWRQATTEGTDMATIVNLLAAGIHR